MQEDESDKIIANPTRDCEVVNMGNEQPVSSEQCCNNPGRDND